MIKEILIGLTSNFVFSLGIFIYKRYHHEKYDEIIKKLNAIENKINNNKITDDKLNGRSPDNIHCIAKDEYYFSKEK